MKSLKFSLLILTSVIYCQNMYGQSFLLKEDNSALSKSYGNLGIATADYDLDGSLGVYKTAHTESGDYTIRQPQSTASQTDSEFGFSKSIARVWNEELLEAIRNDFARPTVHARNLFHISAAMYDVLAAYNPNLKSYFLGNLSEIQTCAYDGNLPEIEDKSAAIREALSFAAYRIMSHRFSNSPGVVTTQSRIDQLMDELGYDVNFSSMDYASDGAGALGNFIAQCVIDFGHQDGSNEQNDYSNQFYQPVNEPLDMSEKGNPLLADPNRWQPLTLETFIDQAGNVVSNSTPGFLSPEWGEVIPFSLDQADITDYQRDGNEFKVYNDPGPPPLLQGGPGSGLSNLYKWGFSLVAVWSAHLSHDDGVMWDISPGSIGNLSAFPNDFEDYAELYDLIEGGDNSQGHSTNPSTGLPYEENLVPRGDYARVLAEFWADGPDSETPPGHWFTLLNWVNDHEALQKQLEGSGQVYSDLDWDILSYFTLGGAMHDAAISAWSIKGYYDYIRPVSAIRYMADQGQSSDLDKDSYNVNGIPLIDGFIALVENGDPLAGDGGEHIGKIKIKGWRGPDHIEDEATDVAGVGWILAEDWWPYQRPSFVTPPFAGYVSGHSTYSRAAAEVLTRFTGDEFFPGGMGEFLAPKNEFLVFEDGPSVDVKLQWATYRDASDQCSLSRIWGGIHPPADDIPGRLIGEYVGNKAYEYAKGFFEDYVSSSDGEPNQSEEVELVAYPNPAEPQHFFIRFRTSTITPPKILLIDSKGRGLMTEVSAGILAGTYKVKCKGLTNGVYILKVEHSSGSYTKRILVKN